VGWGRCNQEAGRRERDELRNGRSGRSAAVRAILDMRMTAGVLLTGMVVQVLRRQLRERAGGAELQ
jgi:hypothetical protein